MIRACLFALLVASSLLLFSQTPVASQPGSLQLPGKFYSKIQKKISSINDKLTKKSLKYLAKFQRQERKLQERIQRLNSDSVTNVLTNADEKYKELSEKIKSKAASLSKITSGEYIPNLDSIGSSLSFLKQFDGISDKVKGPLSSFNQLQSSLQQSERIKAFIAERKTQIKEVLSKYTHFPVGLKNEYAKLNKTAYYYSAQVKEYKEMLRDPDKMEKKALSIMRELPAFQKFMRENSQLAGLFNLPGNYGTAHALGGLQTRDEIQQLIINQMGGGPNAGQLFGQQIQVAQQGLQQFKNKLNKLGGGSGEIEMPDGFKPNNEKVKSFLKRLEYGFNVQFAKTNSLLPATADLALSMGYKLDDKGNTVGVGASYKMGMGSSHHVSFSSQGLGLRSFLDYKIKKQIFISGGYEMNYNAAFKNIAQLRNYNPWQKSGLIGISKKYKISKKVKGNAQLLYDFLAHAHIPFSQPVIFRLGYNF